MAKTKFYQLPTDSYNQPTGYVREIEMTEAEYQNRPPNSYIFRDKIDAERRAQD